MWVVSYVKMVYISLVQCVSQHRNLPAGLNEEVLNRIGELVLEAVRTGLDLVHLIFGGLECGPRIECQRTGGRIEDVAVVQHPFQVGQEGLGR